MSRAPEIKVSDVTKVVYSDVKKLAQKVVQDLSVTFRSGRSSALLGHNGAGKTTTIKLVLGLVRPTRGSVSIDGQEVGEAQRRMIGYMPEVNRIPPVLTPLEVLEYHLAMYRPAHLRDGAARKAAIDEALRRVELWDHRGKRVGKLSKGMARRLAWAQATIHDPSVLILDEPMSGLDPTGRMAMREWISGFRAAGKTIILCSHELVTVGELCDDVNILHKGKLVYAATNEDHRGAYRLSLSGIDDAAMNAMREGARLPECRRVHREGFAVHLDFPDYTAATGWMQAALQRGVVVTGFGPASVFDEEVLLKYFGKELET
jgi:ABC-type multidrug transport system ATPase subunit